MPKLKRPTRRAPSRPAVLLRARPDKPHVFAMTHAGHRTKSVGKMGFDYPVQQEGQTANFVVYYDPSLGPAGQSCAWDARDV